MSIFNIRRTDWVSDVLLVLLVAAYFVRVLLVLKYNPIDHIVSDPERHWTLGTEPLSVTPIAAIDPVGFQIYVGILGKLTVGSPVLVAYWTSLLSLLGPWLWYRFFRELVPQRNLALAGWVVLAALPSWSSIYSYFMQETLMLPLLGAAMWATWRCRRKNDVSSFVLATVVWLMAGLTRGICLPLGATAMAWLWVTQGQRLQRLAIAMALVIAVLGPLAGRSWSIVRLVSPIGIGTMNQLYQRAGTRSFSIEFTRQGGTEQWAYSFLSPSMREPPLAPLSLWPPPREGDVHFKINLDAGARDWYAARNGLPPWDAGTAFQLTAENLTYLLFGVSWPDTNRERFIGEANYWLRWLWGPLLLTCAIATLAMWRRQQDRLLPTLIIVWFIVQGLVPLAVNEGRYRKPVEGLLVAQSLLLLSVIRRRRTAAASAGVHTVQTVAT